MKITNLSVIFVVIAFVIIAVLANYISLQTDTLNKQNDYDTKLIDSTKEAIDAFEINTVQWNSNYSETGDSKRRDIMASINTFTTSFANNLKISGTSRENILSYVPAIAYTLYDGFYIYSPAEVKPTITDEKGVRVVMTKELYEKPGIIGGAYQSGSWDSRHADDNGKILYVPKSGKEMGTYKKSDTETVPFTLNPDDSSESEYKHILKPFATYSETAYIEGDLDKPVVISYTLDNYVSVYGKVGEEYVSKAGYLTNPSCINGLQNGKISGIKYTYGGKQTDVNVELLSEMIAFKEGETLKIENYPYIYDSENVKIYFESVDNDLDGIVDELKPFILEEHEKKYIEDQSPRYKKATIPVYRSDTWSYVERYQNVVDGKWYKLIEGNIYEEDGYYDLESSKIVDFSSINYCVESYVFSTWFNARKLVVKNVELNENGTDNVIKDNITMIINDSNDPEKEDSEFSDHKRYVIKHVVESNLNQAITSYSRRTAGTFKLPKLTETDWDQILKNVSIISFVQNIPIGLKTYNNYAIATSTVNKEYVDPNEIYIYSDYIDNAHQNHIYHRLGCKKLTEESSKMGSNYQFKGFRSIDFMQQQKYDSYLTYDDSDDSFTGYEGNVYYFKHKESYIGGSAHADYINQACYNCLVQGSLFENSNNDDANKAYNTALARERYAAKKIKLPAKVDPSYYLYVEAIDKDTGEIITSGAEFNLIETGVTPTKIKIDNQNWSKKIDFNKEYTVDATSNVGVSDVGITDYGNYDAPKNTNASEPSSIESLYKSTSKITVSAGKIGNSIKVTYSGIQDVEKYGAGHGTGEYRNYGHEESMSAEDDGYINVQLKYQKNYSGFENKLGVTANINGVMSGETEESITMVVTTQTIRAESAKLKFVAYDDHNNVKKTVYSTDSFKLSGEGTQTTIYCKISGTDWHKYDWRASIIVGNKNLSEEEPISYYTIRNKEGLKCLADAVNTDAITLNRTFKLINDINVNETIPPIAGKSGRWFDGSFDGQGYSIKNLTVNNNTKYNCFGLFGWVGKKAAIQNLTIDTMSINLGVANINGEGKWAGGLAGYVDNGSTISNITVKNATIVGTLYTGGIVGHCETNISGAKIERSNIYTCSGYPHSVWIGGIAGKFGNSEKNLNISLSGETINSNIGKSDTLTGSTEGKHKYKYYYYVGGITGQQCKGTNIQSCNVNNASSIKSGKMEYYYEYDEPYTDVNGNTTTYHHKDDHTYDTATGGIVGCKESVQNVTWNTNCTVLGQSSVGGVIGYNAGGTISNITRSAPVTGTGYHIGGIVGIHASGGAISNCNTTNTCTITGSFDNIGGIVGNNKGNGNITNCKNYAKISGNNSVGGIIGKKEGNGNITNCENHSNVQASGSTYTGGIAGHKEGNGNFTNCNNYSTVSGYNYVGGIVGYDINGTIENCNNKEEITGSGNTGGIAGKTNSVNIIGCTNEKKIQGYNGGYFLFDITGIQGTGGIVGIITAGSIKKCKNIAEITCHENAGGIVGIIDGTTTVEYSYNTGKIINTSGDDNRAGGICGSVNQSGTIRYCYNTGEIVGYGSNIWSTLLGGNAAGIGGIVGVNDNDDHNSYLSISYCYNAGKINATRGGYLTTGKSKLNSGGILGYSYGITSANFLNNYYLAETCADGCRIPENGVLKYFESKDNSDGTVAFKKLSDLQFRQQLYNWADSLTEPGGKYIYNTTAPLENDETHGKERGYDGFGVLYWQIPDYARLTTNMFICNRIAGTDSYQQIPNMAFDPRVKLGENYLHFKDLPVTEVDPFSNPVNSSGAHRWIMMIPKGTYNIKGETKYTNNDNPNAKIWIYDSTGRLKVNKESNGEDYNIQEDTTLYVATILKTIRTTLLPKSVNVVWDKQDTTFELIDAGKAYYDSNGEEIREVEGYYELDPNDSKVINQSVNLIKIKLDKNDEYSTTKNQPVRFKNNLTYWTQRDEIYHYEKGFLGIKKKVHDGWKVKGSSNTIQAGTKAIDVLGSDPLRVFGRYGNGYQASCKVYIELNKLTDVVNGATSNYKLQTAKIVMEPQAKMYKAIKQKRAGQLKLKIYITKNGDKIGEDLWSINEGEGFTTETKKWYEGLKKEYQIFNAEELLRGQELEEYLGGSTIEDEFGIVVELLYKCPAGDAEFSIKDISLQVQYDPTED